MASFRMDKRYEDALEKCMERLVKTLPTILDPVFVKMNAYFLDHQREVIQAHTNSTQKVVEFVKTLTTMQNDAFHKFLDVLDQLRYGHLANEIRQAANIPVRELQVPSHSTLSMSGPASMPPPPSITTTTTTGDSDILTQAPTMMLAKEVCNYFAAYWMDIGYCLDFDEDGSQVDLIEEEGGKNPKKCCTLLLKTWIRGNKGKAKTWQTLLDILLSLDQKTAHDKVKEHLQRKQQIPVSRPVEDTDSVTDSLQSAPPSMMSKQRSPESLKRLNNNVSLSRECHEEFEVNQQDQHNSGELVCGQRHQSAGSSQDD